MAYDQYGNPVDASVAQYGANANDAPGYAIDYTDPNSPYHQEALDWLARNPGDWSRVNSAMNSESTGSGIDAQTGQPGFMSPNFPAEWVPQAEQRFKDTGPSDAWTDKLSAYDAFWQAPHAGMTPQQIQYQWGTQNKIAPTNLPKDIVMTPGGARNADVVNTMNRMGINEADVRKWMQMTGNSASGSGLSSEMLKRYLAWLQGQRG